MVIIQGIEYSEQDYPPAILNYCNFAVMVAQNKSQRAAAVLYLLVALGLAFPAARPDHASGREPRRN